MAMAAWDGYWYQPLFIGGDVTFFKPVLQSANVVTIKNAQSGSVTIGKMLFLIRHKRDCERRYYQIYCGVNGSKIFFLS